MKLGLSSYSFRPLMQNGTMTIEDVFGWTRDHGAEHVEIATLSVAPEGADADYDLSADDKTIEGIRKAAQETGIPVSGFCMSGNFVDPQKRDAQIALIKRYVEICGSLSVRFLRHDVVPWSLRAGTAEFEREFAGIIDACQQIASHAQSYGVTTSVEDHGFFMNSSERIKRLIHAVGLPNFKMTVDVGNFLCVDEDAVAATRASLGEVSFLHLKDFYVRRSFPGPGWLQTLNGQYIRGSVFGFGDVETRMILEDVVASGYDGFVSLEYEGNEPTLFGCETGLNNIRRMLEEIRG
jgi:L-ribulose-5-phosphate 3-epimerase